MKFWVCPNCNAVNDEKADCGCGMPILSAILLPTLQWVEFKSIESLDKWLILIKRYGSKIWRRK